MKKILTFVAAALLGVSMAQAIPASPHPIVVTQPDGRQITLKINGDEHYNFYTTVDGYTVLKNEAGYYVYAQKTGGRLTATSTIARNAQERSAGEVALLNQIGRRVIDSQAVGRAKKARAERDEAMKVRRFDYSQFKGLVLLVEFNDCSFSRPDVADFYQKMINQKNYTGYTNIDGSSNPYGNFTGSVRDYFYDQSYGTFDPHFDVIGPIHLDNYSVNSPNQNDNIYPIIKAALQQANSQVDYSQYDLDKDGRVDIFYVIFAGVGSNTGEAAQHVWPHASYMWPTVKLDNVQLGRYACSCELYSQDYGIIDGIGTMCHEFSHVLGLPDLYDTDYGDSGGEAATPNTYEIMDGGGYNNYGRTPAGYSAYDKYSVEFAPVHTITQKGDFSMNSIDSSKDIYKIKTPNPKEFFLLENRQHNKWDAAIPGHGMLVARVDSTNANIWSANDVNVNPDHLYYEILRAGNATASEGVSSDPFPGTKGNIMITNATMPNLKTWTGAENDFNITGIREENGVIYFSVLNKDDVLNDVEDFESMTATTSTSEQNVEGLWANWSFTKSNVTAPGQGKCNGTNAVAMKLPSLFSSSDTHYDAYMMMATVFNTTTTDAKFALSYSTDEGASWKTAKTTTGETAATVSKKTTNTVTWLLDTQKNQATRYRIQQTAGNKNSAAYVDDLTIFYTAKGGDLLTGDVDGNGQVNVSDVTALVNMILGTIPMDQTHADVDGNGQVNVSDVTALVNIILGVS